MVGKCSHSGLQCGDAEVLPAQAIVTKVALQLLSVFVSDYMFMHIQVT